MITDSTHNKLCHIPNNTPSNIILVSCGLFYYPTDYFDTSAKWKYLLLSLKLYLPQIECHLLLADYLESDCLRKSKYLLLCTYDYFCRLSVGQFRG